MATKKTQKEQRNREVLAPKNLPYQIYLLSQQLTRRFQEVLDEHKLTPLHWSILSCLWDEDGLTASQIANCLEQLGGTITVGLNALQRRKLVVRRRDRNDGRVACIHLTVDGKQLQRKVVPRAGKAMQQMFVTLNDREYDALRSGVSKLRKELRDKTKD